MHSYFLGKLVAIVLIAGICFEVFLSFGRIPFQAGADCYVKEVRAYPDGWTSGAWEEPLPKGVQGLEQDLRSKRPQLDKDPFASQLEILVWIPGRGKVPVSKANYQWTNNKLTTLSIDVPSEYYNTSYVVSARLQSSNCYTPRDLGINTDARRLGVQIEAQRWK